MPKLPVRMYLKHGAFWYVERNKWTRLGKDYAEALRVYAGLISGTGEKMPALVDRYMGQVKIAPSTLKLYRIAADRISYAFEEFRPDQVRPLHIKQLMTKYANTPGMANQIRNVMVGAMQLAVDTGLCDTNPAREIKSLKTNRRDRYLTDTEITRIRAKASPTLAAMMDIAYFTGQRIGDVRTIRYADLGEDGIAFRQQKTKHKMIVAWSDELRAAVAAAKAIHQSVKGLTLFHTQQGKVFHYNTIRTLWSRACTAAGVEDAHFHDIRAKAATDAKAQGLNSQALLGHTSESSHLRYLRSKETPIAQPVKRRTS